MTVKKYVAANAREALRRIKQELGPDAIVVSNKAIAEGVEIVAMTASRRSRTSRCRGRRRPRRHQVRPTPGAPLHQRAPQAVPLGCRVSRMTTR
jgi:flagellar biosynthesis protein FlhF